jgi:hypothetical protein
VGSLIRRRYDGVRSLAGWGTGRGRLYSLTMDLRVAPSLGTARSQEGRSPSRSPWPSLPPRAALAETTRSRRDGARLRKTDTAFHCARMQPRSPLASPRSTKASEDRLLLLLPVPHRRPLLPPAQPRTASATRANATAIAKPACSSKTSRSTT